MGSGTVGFEKNIQEHEAPDLRFPKVFSAHRAQNRVD